MPHGASKTTVLENMSHNLNSLNGVIQGPRRAHIGDHVGFRV